MATLASNEAAEKIQVGIVIGDLARNEEEKVGKDQAFADANGGVFPEDFFIAKGPGMASIVQDFIDAVKTASTREELETLVNTHGASILSKARENVNGGGSFANADDRPLYWARIKMMATLKSQKSIFFGNKSRDPLVERLERVSRGYDGVKFDDAPSGAKLVLLSGFDPFFMKVKSESLFNGSAQGNIKQGNPSGSISLALHGKTVDIGGGQVAYIQSFVIPTRYRDFDAGKMEGLYSDFIKTADTSKSTVYTISQALPGQIWIDRFAANTRGLYLRGLSYYEIPDNDFREGPVDGRLLPLNSSSPHFIETTLPINKLFSSSENVATLVYNQTYSYLDPTFIKREVSETTSGARQATTKRIEDSPSTLPNNVELATSIGFDSQYHVIAGSGGEYLSNEIFYRVSKLRKNLNPNLMSGHIHVNKLQNEGSNYLTGDDIDLSGLKTLIQRIEQIIKLTFS